MRVAVFIAVALAAASFGAPVSAANKTRDPEKLPVTRIRDLHYGDVLFHYYQQDDFEAITRLNAYEHWHLLEDHKAESQLLLGGMYLALGLHNEAGQRFETLLTQDVPASVRNRAWFYLAKVWYSRGYLDRTRASLEKIDGSLSPALQAERQQLYANTLMRLGEFDAAATVLKSTKGPADWMAYANFNLGIALVRADKLEEASLYLTRTGTMDVTRPELLALRDRANLALGFAYLQKDQPALARPVLERVRLNGPYSNKALLGVGWADAALGDYQRALTPWIELRERNVLDSAVQEAYLAIPYAFGKLEDNQQAAENYERAVQSFDEEVIRIDDAMQRIRGGSMLDEMLAKEKDAKDANYGWFWQLRELPDAPESRYLYTVLADHDFQEGLKNYRDLTYMGTTLDRWADSMVAFSDMIDTRERAYAYRIPRADGILAANAPDAIQRVRDDLEGRLKGIEASTDVAALGSDEERAQWARVQSLEAALAAAPASEDTAALRERLRLVKGVLQYRLNDTFKTRMWQQRRTIKELDTSLREAHNRFIRVEKARQSAPFSTSEFATRIAALRARIEDLHGRLVLAEKAQNGYLAELAVKGLDDQKQRLATYQVQARFSLGSIYDRAAAPPPSPAPTTDGASEDEPEEMPANESGGESPQPDSEVVSPDNDPAPRLGAPADDGSGASAQPEEPQQ